MVGNPTGTLRDLAVPDPGPMPALDRRKDSSWIPMAVRTARGRSRFSAKIRPKVDACAYCRALSGQELFGRRGLAEEMHDPAEAIAIGVSKPCRSIATLMRDADVS